MNRLIFLGWLLSCCVGCAGSKWVYEESKLLTIPESDGIESLLSKIIANQIARRAPRPDGRRIVYLVNVQSKVLEKISRDIENPKVQFISIDSYDGKQRRYSVYIWLNVRLGDSLDNGKINFVVDEISGPLGSVTSIYECKKTDFQNWVIERHFVHSAS
jgi:hypothetical protein